MSEENCDIPSEHNVKSVIKKAQLRGWRFRSSKLSSDKGSVKSEDRVEFGIDSQCRTTRIYNSVKGWILELGIFLGSSFALPELSDNEESEEPKYKKSKFLKKAWSASNKIKECSVSLTVRVPDNSSTNYVGSSSRVIENPKKHPKLKLVSMMDMDVENEVMSPFSCIPQSGYDISIGDVRAAI